MTLAHENCDTPAQRSRQPATDVLIGREPDILADIFAPGVAAAIWQRTPVTGFQDWINGVAPENLPEMNATVPVHLVEAAVLAACGNAGMAESPYQDRLASDAGALALMFCKVMDLDQIRVRLDVADDVMCPKFHTDNVSARLLCTYRGAGTEYVSARHQADPKRIRSVSTGSVGLFRGRQFPSDEDCGLLHRSPAVEAKCGTRLLLVIDAAT